MDTLRKLIREIIQQEIKINRPSTGRINAAFYVSDQHSLEDFIEDPEDKEWVVKTFGTLENPKMLSIEEFTEAFNEYWPITGEFGGDTDAVIDILHANVHPETATAARGYDLRKTLSPKQAAEMLLYYQDIDKTDPEYNELLVRRLELFEKPTLY